MNIDLSRFKVVYGEKVLNAISLQEVSFDGDWEEHQKHTINKPKFITVLAINEDGNIIEIHDEAWMFQFIPIVQK
ncbi:hypothetical protein SAMN05443270_3756 [Lacrimispora sphenoides]|uniref:hypothetical protein n=1 Tax=Lacrimispora sphenoides TaxID=29370 RepID=UPI0008B83376|nr:hypothetical protein [Lacrimispora sphenoides]SEU24204.1 hypothetical protein SAMN05443270_3756 [Lacrimispora sphenoides]